MFKVDEHNNIWLTKGNTAELGFVPLWNDGTPIQPVSGDKVIFTVEFFGEVVLRQELEFDTSWDEDERAFITVLEPDDTLKLECLEYKYDALYVFADGVVKTFIDESNFTIVRAISRIGDTNE